MIELALPAGSLETALTAFSYGADAVYFGLKEFSARKGAVNFSIEDLSRIRRYSLENGKKTYITINTLIDDASTKRVFDILDQVAFYGTDGIIIQDLGIADIIRRCYPTLPLHGSTQLAVHTAEGVRELQDLGFERVVLSRELSMEEIRRIRQECPDVELKVFIHGALCYGFSGLCSASAIKCNRSANGGECAQICRSWFQDDDLHRKGFFFSMEDMDAGERILELDRMGIDSAKVEGRLKSPEYVAAVTRYYRSILDKGRASLQEEDDVKTSFLRKSGDGYLSYKPDRPSLLSGGYPGHLGLYVGQITDENGDERTVETEIPLENHDGLQYFTADSKGLPVANKLSARIVRKGRNYVKLLISDPSSLIGKDLYKISDSTKREKTPSTNIPLYRKPVDIRIRLEKDSIEAEALGIRSRMELAISPSRTPKDPVDVLSKAFSESGLSRYTLSRLSFDNESGIEYPFLPPSIIKEFRRSFYSKLDSAPIVPQAIPEPDVRIASSILPDRRLLSDDLPWSIIPKTIDGRAYITLPPVTFNEKKTWEEALENIKGMKDVSIGLNNISQIRFAKAHPEYRYFADIYLYTSNRFTAALLAREIPGFIGGYLWFERDSYSGPWPYEPTIADFEPPYFISRTCYRHDAMKKPCKGCPGKEDYHISQAPDSFTVKVRSCLTVVERDK